MVRDERTFRADPGIEASQLCVVPVDVEVWHGSTVHGTARSWKMTAAIRCADRMGHGGVLGGCEIRGDAASPSGGSARQMGFHE